MIYGVNDANEGAGNEEMCDGRDIGLLQDTPQVNAWGSWDAVWRDVFVLDRNGELVGILNLTESSLAEPENVEALQALFDEAMAR